MGSGDVHFVQIHRHHKHFLFFRTGFGEDFAGGAGDETLTPELDAIAGEPFVTDAIGDGNITPIGLSCATAESMPTPT